MKVDFLIIGAQKGGSTWLYDNIRVHPQVYTPKEEVHFFSFDEHYNRGPEWYHAHFANGRDGKVLGEKTPEYLPVVPTVNPRTSTETVRRIYRYNKDIKLIAVLREPVSRLQSAITHMYRTQRVSPWVKPDELVSGKFKQAGEKFSLLEHGLYYENLSRYLDFFSRDQLKILFFETDVLLNPLSTMESVCFFLGIPFSKDFFPLAGESKNENQMSFPALALNHVFPGLRFLNNRLNHIFPTYKPRLSDRTRAMLQEYYAPSNAKLKELTGSLPDKWKY